MKNMNIKAILYGFFPFFVLGTFLLVVFQIPGLAFCGIVACGFLVPLFFSKDVEELNIKGFTLVKRFRKDFDRDLKEHVDMLIDKSLATVDEKITDAVGDKLGAITGTTMHLQQDIQSLQHEICLLRFWSRQPRLNTASVSLTSCPRCGGMNFCKDDCGIRCADCCEYVCKYRTSLC